MNSQNIISFLKEDSILSLFNFEIPIEDKKDYFIDKKFIIIQLKKITNRENIMYTATFRDIISKYNGFLIIETNNNQNLKENSLINVELISPRYYSTSQSRVFIIKKYKVLFEDLDVSTLPEATLIQEENIDFLSHNLSNNNNINNYISNNIDNSICNRISNNLDDHIPKYTSLKQLTTFSKDFIIYVRIIQKSEIKVFNSNNNIKNPSRSNGKLFNFIVLDKDENEMQCTCFNKAVDKFFDVISEGKIYEIKGGYVKINDKKFRTIKSDYKIVLDENSQIIEKKDDGRIKVNNLKIIKINEIQNMNLYSIVDICAVVLDIGEKAIKHTRNGDQLMKKILIGDISKCQIEFSLWRNHASIEVKISDILLLNNVKIGEFNGRNLSTIEESSIHINPPNSIKEVLELENFIKNYKEPFHDLEYLNTKNTKNNENNDNYDVVYIKDTLDSRDTVEDVISITKICATVTQILHNEKNYYLGCSDRNCKRKLIYEANRNEYFCENCNRSYETPNYYYTLSLRVKDASCEHWIDIFDKSAENIMKMKPEEYKNILKDKNNSKLKEISNRIEFKQFNFWVKSKLQKYNNVSKKKLYAYKLEPVNDKDESKKIIKYLYNLLDIH